MLLLCFLNLLIVLQRLALLRNLLLLEVELASDATRIVQLLLKSSVDKQIGVPILD